MVIPLREHHRVQVVVHIPILEQLLGQGMLILNQVVVLPGLIRELPLLAIVSQGVLTRSLNNHIVSQVIVNQEVVMLNHHQGLSKTILSHLKEDLLIADLQEIVIIEVAQEVVEQTEAVVQVVLEV